MYSQKQRSERRKDAGLEDGRRKQPLDAGKARKQSLPKRKQPPRHLDVSPVNLTLDFRSLEL